MLEKRLAPAPPVEGSRASLVQVVVSLVTNAAQAIADGRPRHGLARAGRRRGAPSPSPTTAPGMEPERRGARLRAVLHDPRRARHRPRAPHRAGDRRAPRRHGRARHRAGAGHAGDRETPGEARALTRRPPAARCAATPRARPPRSPRNEGSTVEIEVPEGFMGIRRSCPSAETKRARRAPARDVDAEEERRALRALARPARRGARRARPAPGGGRRGAACAPATLAARRPRPSTAPRAFSRSAGSGAIAAPSFASGGRSASVPSPTRVPPGFAPRAGSAGSGAAGLVRGGGLAEGEEPRPRLEPALRLASPRSSAIAVGAGEDERRRRRRVLHAQHDRRLDVERRERLGRALDRGAVPPARPEVRLGASRGPRTPRSARTTAGAMPWRCSRRDEPPHRGELATRPRRTARRRRGRGRRSPPSPRGGRARRARRPRRGRARRAAAPSRRAGAARGRARSRPAVGAAGKIAASRWRAARSCARPTASNCATTSNGRSAARAASRASRAYCATARGSASCRTRQKSRP